MITIAASDLGDYLFLVIMLVFGLINWVANKIKEGKAPPQPPQRRESQPGPRPMASAPPSRNAEEERMRRFLEALGVPQDEAPAPPPPPPRPAPLPVAPPPRKPVVTRTAPPPLPREQPSLDEAELTNEPVEHIHLPELPHAPVPEFETISSRVSANRDGDFVTVASSISAVPPCPVHRDKEIPPPAQAAPRIDYSAILARLRSRPDVRAALILSEILGPPRSLRSSRS